MIRQVLPEEAPRAAQVYQLCAKAMNEHGFYNWNENYPSVREAERDAQSGTLYGYYRHEELCGLVTLDQQEVPQYAGVPFLVPRGEALTVHRLAVSPLHQQRGISRELLRYGMRLAAEKGLRALHIDCLSINPGPMRLIASLGFRRVGEIYYPKKDPRVRDYPFYCFEKMTE